MASKTAKSLAGICCFLRPHEWSSLGTEHLSLLLWISSQWTRQTVEPTWSWAALAKSSGRKCFLPAQLWLLLSAFSHFSAEEPQNQSSATRRTTCKKIALVKRKRARNSVIFCFWCKHQTPWCKRLKLKRKISFSMRRTFPLPSSANSYFLFSNFAVWDFILFTLDFNT